MVKTSHSNADGMGWSPGRRTKVSYSSGSKSQNIKQKQYCNKINKDFKNDPHQKKNVFLKDVITTSTTLFRSICLCVTF